MLQRRTDRARIEVIGFRIGSVGCPAGRNRGRRIAMAIEWKKDVDGALTEGGRSKRPLLLDFSAAPM
jgi:hypothetical protein